MIELVRTTRTSTAPPRRFYERWVDHATWPQWDTGTERARLDGPVRPGTRGVLKPQGGPKVRFRVAQCEPDRTYTDVTTLPGATLTFRHTAAPAGSGSELGVHVYLQGPLGWLWARTAFKGFERDVPDALDRLIALVEASDRTGAPR